MPSRLKAILRVRSFGPENGDAVVPASAAPGSKAIKIPSTLARLKVLAAGLIVAFCLVSTSTVRRVGDGAEYLAMAIRLSEFRAPAMTPGEIQEMQARLAGLEHGFGGVPLSFPLLTASDGRQDQIHFWFYSLLAVPEIWFLKLFGLPPYYSFTLLNVGLLLGALWIVSAILDWPALLLLFMSPVIWWIDKAHTEVFTFSLLAVAMSTMVDRPWWALISVAIASTQNPPLALLLPLFFLTAAAIKPILLHDRHLYLGSTAAVVIAALTPLYYWTRLHTPISVLLTGSTLMTPSLARFLVFLDDPNFGLIVWCPFLVFATIATAVVLWFRSRAALLPAITSTIVALLFMYSFAQTPNLNSGGTFGMARYAVWLIPLAIPVLAKGQAAFGARYDRWLLPLAVVGTVWSAALAHPRFPESYLYPTWLAERIWLYHPSLNNPPAEVFYERMAHKETPIDPVATANCAKILLVGGRPPMRRRPYASSPDEDRGRFVRMCVLREPIPHSCSFPAAVCYANRTSSGYEIIEAPR